jgi:HSP20 family protein
VVVKATVPGVKPEDIEVTITGDVLTIKGEFKTEEKTEKHNYLRQERRYGSFCRQLSVPAGADVDKVKATFEHGVLTLELPKVEAAKAKTVKVVAK